MTRRWFMQLLTAIPLLGLGCPALLAAQKRHIPTTVDELYLAMCEAMPVGSSTNIGFAVTGDAYREYALRAYASNPKAIPAICQAMWFTFLKVWRESDNPRGAVLYWRIKPELAFYDETWPIEGKCARIYLRYAVSSRPALYSKEQLLNMYKNGLLDYPPSPFENGIEMARDA